MDYLEQWSRNVIARRSVALCKSVQAVALYDKHTGPSWQFAKVELRAEPAKTFDVVFDLPAAYVEVLQKDGWLDEVVFGVLDVLTTSEPSPVLGLTLHVVAAEHDSITSSRIAFRVAGRMAARELLRESKAS